jgi:hypothetical protein
MNPRVFRLAADYILGGKTWHPELGKSKFSAGSQRTRHTLKSPFHSRKHLLFGGSVARTGAIGNDRGGVRPASAGGGLVRYDSRGVGCSRLIRHHVPRIRANITALCKKFTCGFMLLVSRAKMRYLAAVRHAAVTAAVRVRTPIGFAARILAR